MIQKRLNIPAVLVHSIKNKKYQVPGIILSINESTDTCKMRFKGNRIETIPMNKILINEGFLDKIKEYGKKAANYIVQKVKGFIALVDDTTKTFLNWSKQNIANLAIMASKKQLPEGVFFAPSKTAKRLAGVNGMSLDQAMQASLSKDINDINKFWTRVIKRAGTKDETITESIDYVKRNYYKLHPVYENMYKKANALNEVIYTLDNPKWGPNKIQSRYGRTVGAEKLRKMLINNFENQTSGELGEHAIQKPYLIWGAPGIGKTAIIHQAIKELAASKHGINLNLICIQLSTLSPESWTLPKDTTRKRGDGVTIEAFTDTPPIWLPVYLDSGNREINKARDAYYNSCKYSEPEELQRTNKNGEKTVSILSSNDGRAYEGGIIFFDEFTRRLPGVDRNLMGLINEYRFGSNYKLASKWGFVFAANRAMDDSGDKLSVEDDSDSPFNMDVAVYDRFTFVTYVPSKAEWLKWARKINSETGESKVLPFIIDFIEASDDNVWYSTIVNGGYNDLLDDSEKDQARRAHEIGKDSVADLLNKDVLQTSRLTTPRTWAKISDTFKLELIKLFRDNPDGIPAKDYYEKLVKQSVIEKTDKDGKSYKEYYGSILPDILVDALNDLDEESWDYWVDLHFDEDELALTKNYYGVMKRYNMLMDYFLQVVRE